MTRSKDELEEAAQHVKDEWAEVAKMASLMPRDRETAALEATLVHARCLILFCCGGYKGKRDRSDIVPKDFLGVDWWPRDEDFDRQLRGRLRFINHELQHLSWQRVLNKEPLIVPVVLVAHEVHWGMLLFVDELRAKQNDWLDTFAPQEQLVGKLLPPLGRLAETVPHLAPARGSPIPP